LQGAGQLETYMQFGTAFLATNIYNAVGKLDAGVIQTVAKQACVAAYPCAGKNPGDPM
jgi:hypothetical protein